MKNLIIIGTSGFGREIYHLATQCQGYMSEFQIKGFIDDRLCELDKFSGYPPFLGTVEGYVIQPHDVFVCAKGFAQYKKQHVESILKKGGGFYSLIHPSSAVSPNTSIGQGAIIMAHVFISCEVRIGDFVTLQPFCVIGHDAKIESFAHLNAYAFLGGYAQVEEGGTLHTGAKILPHKKVGAWAVVGAGSVVLRNVKSGVTVFGMPSVQIVE